MSAALAAIGPVMLVGAGKMGLAMASGWLEKGLPPANLILIEPRPSEAVATLVADYGLALYPEAGGLQPNVIVLAVKPQVMDAAMAGLAPVIGPHTIGLSIAAGIDIARLSRGLATGRIVRAMPNTPAQIGKGVTGAVAAPGLERGDRDKVEPLLAAVGAVVWLEKEADLDAVTAVSGSGPAYVFHLVEALAEAARNQGLAPHLAMRLARETVIGAAALMDADPADAATLRANVTSPNGTTAAALSVLMAELPGLMDRTVAAARRRSEELGRD